MALLLGGTVILIVGIIDDVYQLPAKVKLLGQIAAAAVLVLFDIRIEWLTIRTERLSVRWNRCWEHRDTGMPEHSF